MKYSKDPQIEAAIAALVAKGCTFEKDRPHNKLVFPSGRKRAMPWKPSDYRAAQNFLHQIKGMLREEGLL